MWSAGCLRALFRVFSFGVFPVLLFLPLPSIKSSTMPGPVLRAAAAASGSRAQVLRENAIFFNMLTTFAYSVAIVEPTWEFDVKDLNINLITRQVRDTHGGQIVRVRVAGVVRSNNNVELNILDPSGAIVGKGFYGYISGQLTFYDRLGTPIINGLMYATGLYSLFDLRLPESDRALASGGITGGRYSWYGRDNWSGGGGKLVYDRFDEDAWDHSYPTRMYWTFESGRLSESTPAYGDAEFKIDKESTGSINSVLFDTTRTAESFFIHPDGVLPDPQGIAFLPRLKNGTGIGVTNISGREIRVTYTARRFDGSLVQGNGIENPVDYIFPAGRQFAAYPSDIFAARGTFTRPLLFGDDEIGWLEVRSDDGKIGAMYLEGDDGGHAMDGNVAAQSGGGPLIFPDIRVGEGEATEISILNLAYDPLTLRAELCDREGIIVAEQGDIFIAGRGLRNFRLDPDSNFLRVPDAASAASLRVSCASQPQSSNCARLVGLATHQDHFRSLSTLLAQPSSAGGSSLVGPYFVAGPGAGGEWTTWVRVAKLSGSRGDVQLTIQDADGKVLGSLQQSIPPGGQAPFLLNAASMNGAGLLTAGSLRLSSSSGLIAGDVTVSWTDGRESMISSYKLTNQLSAEYLFNQVAVGAAGGIEYWTGIGLLNESEQAVQARLDILLPDGSQELSASIDLRPHQQMATLLTQLLSEPEYKRINGYMRITAGSPIAAIVFYGDSQSRFLATVPGIAP